jgi:hypothetical protein
MSVLHYNFKVINHANFLVTKAESASDRAACGPGFSVMCLFYKVTSYEYFVKLTGLDLCLSWRAIELL